MPALSIQNHPGRAKSILFTAFARWPKFGSISCRQSCESGLGCSAGFINKRVDVMIMAEIRIDSGCHQKMVSPVYVAWLIATCI